MFREPRRKDRTISIDEGLYILNEKTWGTLGTISEDGWPYAVPLSYVYSEKNNAIYFHCASVGHKIENLEFSDKVSFTVVGKTKVQPELFSTLYESVIVFGKCTQVTGQEKLNAFMEFIAKYNPAGLDQVEQKVRSKGDAVRVYKIEIEHITAKAKRLK